MDKKNQREIKFRAWDKERKEMFIGFSFENIYAGQDESYVDCEKPNDFWSQPHWDNAILMQYTGLKDKNGKGIYEGDLVEKRGWIGRIFWSGDFWATGNGNYDDAGLGGKNNTLEVIGNIYENPELLDNYLTKFREWCLRKWGNG